MGALGTAFSRTAFNPQAFNTEGGVRAPAYAQFGVMRFGAFRFGYTSPKVFVKVGGVQRANGREDETHILQDLSIIETNNSTPNKAAFTAKGSWEPTSGMEVVVTMGSINRIRRMFAGSVLSVNETNNGRARNFRVDCVDWSWDLDNSPLVYGFYEGTYDEIARELMSEYAPTAYTVRQVETGLPTCTGGITFTGVKLSKALDRLQKRARGEGINLTKFIDYNQDLYFRQTQGKAWTSPRTITIARDDFFKLAKRSDLSQIANRVPFIGGGANALTEIAAGETILPLTDAPDYWYGDLGGIVVSGPQKITYTARVAGGGGSVVGPGQAPSTAPTVALASGSGVTDGLHTLTTVWKTATGRTLPGPPASITVGVVSAPASAPSAGTVQAGSGPNDGAHLFAISYVTAAGETPPGPTVSKTTSTVAAYYASAPASTMSGTATQNVNTVDNSQYNIGDSVYHCLTYVTAAGETTPNSSTSPATALQCTDVFQPTKASPIEVSGIPVPTDPNVLSKRLYRNVNGSWTGYSSLANNVTTQPDNSVVTAGSPPGANTALVPAAPSQRVPLSWAAPASPLVTHVKVWGTVAGGSQLKLITTVTAATTSHTVTTTDASLGTNAPSSNTATANQISVSAIAVGPSGTTEREIYMDPAGGGTRRLALTIPNNTATTGTITISDATLAGEIAEPIADTSGLAQPSGQILPGDTEVVVSGTAPFQATGGWAFTGTQQFRYTAYSGNELTGVPASGAGSIQQPINYGTTIAAAPCLTGVPASGDGSIRYTIPKGEPVNLYVIVEDTDAQADLQERMDADEPVVRECEPLADRRLKRTEAITRASAFMALRAYQSVSLSPVVSRDVNCRAGLSVSVNVTEPHDVNDTFKIQSVTISGFSQALRPNYTMQLSDELFSVEDLFTRE